MLEAALMGAAAGLASIPHCAGMCGPLSAATCAGRPPGALGSYQAGRLLAYAVLGALAGGAGAWASAGVPARWGSALLSWSLGVGLLVAAGRLLRGVRSTDPREGASAGLVPLRRDREDVGATRRRRLRPSPAVVGLLTGALPCGALYAALLLAAGTGDAAAGALGMVAFGAVSGTALLGVGLIAGRLHHLATPPARRLLAVSLAIGALVMALRPLPGLWGDPPGCHPGAATGAVAASTPEEAS